MSWVSYQEEEEGLVWNLDKTAAKQETAVHFLFQLTEPGNVSDRLEDFQLFVLTNLVILSQKKIFY